MNKITIDYFSDVLCVWAYVAQRRVDELRHAFGDRIEFNYHFIPVFGVVQQRVGEAWQERGGYTGFGAHVLKVVQEFPHVKVHANIWRGQTPVSSANAHLFLKAVQHLVANGELEERVSDEGRSLFEETMWQMRLAFFRDNRDITCRKQQIALANEMGLPTDKIINSIDDGSAMAGICSDVALCKDYGINGSPSYVLNEGRQKLYGNVGYKLIAANVSEILHHDKAQASWC